jgi:hypothetical protein
VKTPIKINIYRVFYVMSELDMSSINRTNYEEITQFEKNSSNYLDSISLQVQLSAVTIATTAMLIFYPSVETISISIFIFGYLFRIRFGISLVLSICVGWEIVASMVFGFSGILFPFKILGWLIVFNLGTIANKIRITKNWEFALLGAFSAVIWDLILLFAIPLTLSTTGTDFMVLLINALVFGLPFTIAHIIANTTFFLFVRNIISTILPVLKMNHSNLLNNNLEDFE